MAEPLDTVRFLNARFKTGPEPDREQLQKAKSVLLEHRGAKGTGFEYMLARVDARLHAINTGQPIVEPEKPKADKAEVAKGLSVLAVIGLVVAACVSNMNDDNKSSGGGRDEIGAGVACEEFVKRQLRAPATADFPNFQEYVVTGSGDQYTVQGYVDAQNGFGALIRSDWSCSIQRDEEQEQWTLTAPVTLN
ncbi:hypothetical protein [Geodermatophilus aquaeductus]|nr:hypothetical protein [Geodermatophilus aquaeductus]